jgi:LmbE family N-acetylglucosaminyl deacetylase
MTQLLETSTPTTFLGVPAGGNALVALAHPDDEFLVGGALELLRQNEITTHAIIASDGEGSDRGHPDELRNLLRRREAGKALGHYGVRMENQHFLGLPDGELSDDEHVVSISLAMGRLLAEHSIRSIVTLGRHGYDNHLDHIALHDAAELAASAYATANPNLRLFGLTRNPVPIQVPADPVLKLRRLASHKSQFDIDLTDPAYQPVPGTVEQPGIRLSPASRGYLDRYYENMHIERYAHYPLDEA